MRIFRASMIFNRLRPEGLEHLVGAAAEQDRVSLRHVPQIRLRELFVRHDPIKLSVFGGKVAVGTQMIEHNDSSHVTVHAAVDRDDPVGRLGGPDDRAA